MVFMYIITYCLYLTLLKTCSIIHILSCKLVLILIIFSIPFSHATCHMPTGFAQYLLLYGKTTWNLAILFTNKTRDD